MRPRFGVKWQNQQVDVCAYLAWKWITQSYPGTFIELFSDGVYEAVLVRGDPGAFESGLFTDQPACILTGFPLPRGAEDETKTNLSCRRPE